MRGDNLSRETRDHCEFNVDNARRLLTVYADIETDAVAKQRILDDRLRSEADYEASVSRKILKDAAAATPPSSPVSRPPSSPVSRPPSSPLSRPPSPENSADEAVVGSRTGRLGNLCDCGSEFGGNEFDNDNLNVANERNGKVSDIAGEMELLLEELKGNLNINQF